MPKNIYLSECEKEKIDELRTLKKNISEIAKQVKRSRKCISNYLRSPSTYGTKIKNSGRPLKCSEKTKRVIRRSVFEKSKSLRSVENELSHSISYSTIRRRLNDMDILSTKMKSKPILTKSHKLARIEMAKTLLRNGPSYISSIVFSDEKKFNLDGPDGFRYYWHDINLPESIFSRKRNGGSSVMIWAAISYNSKSDICFINGTLNSVKYQEILSKYLIPFINQINNDSVRFQQDNAPAHSSKATKQWLIDHNINTFQWSPNSPDINIIENVWGILARKIYSENFTFCSISELKKYIVKEWKLLDQNIIRNLYNSCIDRLISVVENNGSFLNK